MTTGIEQSMSAPADVGRRVGWVLGLWSLAALAVALSGRFTELPRAVIPATILSTVATGVVLFSRSPALRAWVGRIDMRAPILLHALRAPIGAAFLWELAHGQLPSSFALTAGIGDLVAGLGALIAALAWPARTPARRRVVGIWNAVALLDIVLVVITAQRELFFGGGLEAMRAFERFPYPLLPTLVVPLVFLSHFAIAWRLRTQRA